MKRAVVFIFVACCAVSVLSLGEEKKSKPPATVKPAAQFSPSVGPTTTLSPNTTTATTHSPNTTTATTHSPNTTTATTHSPNTTTATTHSPNTTTATTHSPNTTTATTHSPNTTTTTTHSPNTTTATTTPTTTTAKTTAPPAPEPTPPVNATLGNYNITKDKKVCLMAQMTLQIRLSTPNANGTFNVQPNKTHAEGNCMDTKANLTLVFKEGFITFMFNKSAADQTVYVDALSFSVSYPLNKGVTAKGPYTASNKSLHLFPAKVKHSYSCKSESLFMGNGLYLDVSQDRMQAFNLTNNEFGTPDPCPADQPSYHVAIAVGVTLLVLIVIVVVAYLLSRRRRTDGYQSL